MKKKTNEYAKEGEEMRQYLHLILNTTPEGKTKGGPDSQSIKEKTTYNNESLDQLLNNNTILKSKSYTKKSLTINSKIYLK